MTPPSLLLLPSPPQPPARAAFFAAYRAPLTAVLGTLKDAASPSTLVVALATPLLAGPAPRAKTLHWHRAQSLTAALYTLVAVVSAELSIETDVGADLPGSVDVRVVLVDHARGRTYYPDYRGAYPPNCTAVLDLPAFASTVFPWTTVFHPSSEAGYELLSTYLKFAEGRHPLLQHQLVAVPGGVSLSTDPAATTSPFPDQHIKGYSSVCLGGTFDHLHPGHKLLLHATALLLKIPDADSTTPCELIVGISGDALLQNKKHASELQPWPQRATSVLSFLATILNPSTSAPPPPTHPRSDELHAVMRGGAVRVRCVNIPDPFGPTITEEAIYAIAVSGETRGGGAAINDRRTHKGWAPLDVFEIDVLNAREGDEDQAGAAEAEDFASKISSTAIRQRRAELKADTKS